MERSSLTRLFLRLFVASIVVNAVLGIWALLAGDFGDTQGKVLATSFLVSAAMLSVLLNSPAIGRRALWPAPLVGAAAGAAGFALFTVLLWADADEALWFRLAGSLLVVAAAATLSSSLALVPRGGGPRWLPAVADLLIAILAVTAVAGIWFEPGRLLVRPTGWRRGGAGRRRHPAHPGAVPVRAGPDGAGRAGRAPVAHRRGAGRALLPLVRPADLPAIGRSRSPAL